MSEEMNNISKTNEEQRIDRMNLSVSSTYTHIFIRTCTILGYSLILSFAIGCHILMISIPSISSSNTYPNGVPQVSLYKEYYLFCLPSFLFIFIGMSLNTYCYDVCSNGIKDIVQGTRRHVIKIILLLSTILSVVVLIFLLSVKFGANVVIAEAVLYLLCLIIFCLTWVKYVLIWIKHAVVKCINALDPLVTNEKKLHMDNLKKIYEEEKKDNVVVKKKGAETNQTIMNLFYISVILVVSCYYIYVTIIIYRQGSYFTKAFIALVLHPILVDGWITFLKFSLGSRDNVNPPFYEHLYVFGLEVLLNLFRRFLFNDITDQSTSLIFIFTSGIEELCTRTFMEKKEVYLRRLFGHKSLTLLDLYAKRRFYSHTVTARSILELVSIIVAPIMIICFSQNRLFVDLGYNGLEEVDVSSLFISTILQIVIELFVVYMCSLIEIRQNVPMSDFFFQYRSFSIFLAHYVFFAGSCHWILHNLKTIPNELFCKDVKDPCSCIGFSVYDKICPSIIFNNTASQVSMQLNNYISNSSTSIINLPLLLSALGIFFIFVFSLFFVKSPSISSIRKRESAPNILEKFKKENLLNDVATNLIKAESSTSQAINLLTVLCRGLPPNQIALLENVIAVLKKQSKGTTGRRSSVVNVRSLLINGMSNKNVMNELENQLLDHDDKEILRDTSEEMNERIDRKRSQNVNKVNSGLPKPIEFLADEEFDFEDFLKWEFDVFSIKAKNLQCFFAWKCFSSFELIDELNLGRNQLYSFLLFVENNYSMSNYDDYGGYINNFSDEIPHGKDNNEDSIKKGNLYHNNLHGADVFQAVLYFCKHYEEIGGNFSSLELFSVLFAAYIHDFNHPGLNTTFMISDWPYSGISSTFGTDSPLEKHHLAMAFNLLRNEEEYNFMTSFLSSELDIFRKIVTECVMATDLAKSMSWIANSRVAFNDIRLSHGISTFNLVSNISAKVYTAKAEQQRKEFDHKLLKMQLVIKCADVGHPARLLNQHLEWSSRICEEFYCQGDKEKKMGMKISPLCDRNISLSNYPQSQIGFINFITKPLYALMNEISSTSKLDDDKPWMKNIISNVEYWESKKVDTLQTETLESNNRTAIASEISEREKNYYAIILQKEETRVENLNQDSANDYMHFFTRTCTILGYSVILSLFVTLYIILVGLPTISETGHNDLPSVNTWKEFFLWGFPTPLFVFTFSGSGSYLYQISGTGLTGFKSFAIILQFAKYFSLFVFSMILNTFISIQLVELGLDTVVSEFIFYFIFFITFSYFWPMFVTSLHETQKEFYANLNLNTSSKKFAQVTKYTKIQIICMSLVNIAIGSIGVYYVYLLIILFRLSNYSERIIIVSFIHPVFVEFILTMMKVREGISKFHPIFDTSDAPFLVEAMFNLFRRFLFNYSNSSLTIILVIISGIQEVLVRSYMEWKERYVRKLLGMKQLSEVEMIQKRIYYSETNTARSIIELTSIILAPVIFVVFFKNRYAVDLGYDGLDINVSETIAYTVFQLIIELFVIYMCSLIEKARNLPLSDYFFQLRSPIAVLNHLSVLGATSTYILHNFKTVPTLLLCSDVRNPCSCPSFQVYQNTICNGYNYTNLDTSELNSSSSANVSLVILFSIVLVGLLIGGINFLCCRRNAKKRPLASNLKEDNLRVSKMDETTKALLERSSLQQAILMLENLARGVSPAQVNALSKVIDLLKLEGSGDRDDVNVARVLQDSSKDKTVVKWLEHQLGNQDVLVKQKSVILGKEFLTSGNVTNAGENSEIDNRLLDDLTLLSLNIGDEEFLKWEFDVFSIKGKNLQSFLAWKCFSGFKLIDELNLERNQLYSFLLFVENNYSMSNYDDYGGYINNFSDEIPHGKDNNDDGIKKSNLYHNNLHGADVFQAVLYFCKHYEEIGGNFSSLELFSVLFAAYIHDFNHPGLNTTFMISDWPYSGISSTFGTDSPLEKHHLAMAFRLLRNKDKYNFMNSFSSNNWSFFRKIVTECVMATDLANSMSWIAASRLAFNDHSDNLQKESNSLLSDTQNKEFNHKLLKMQLVIKCADVGHPARLLNQHLEWSSRICEEFYCQGDKEKKMGMKISPLCDRNISLSNYPQSQIGFINFITKPLYALMNEIISTSKLDEDKPWMKNIISNVEYWESKKAEFLMNEPSNV